ncbi:helix-turn-helix domain-containing protein [Usitatibacter palustris]|uniref:HTH-type transcriptional regulator RamB n=1 Tax=Usitatibacter palustris TaxID=2732487 RepID=A0A6M4H511_9PROT|nr:short-chain fatty acyl-CoA regulator family protein [Usitatibacter palustris]QJR14362.1 HTH-type transcriptional regulator RamB [Usitatibacter palustris]
MARSLIGARIRDRRRARGYTQSWLAARVEISPSYLNLIEGNKRNIGGALLGRIASELGLEIDEIDGAAERRLLSDLVELAGEPVLAELGLDARSAGDLAARHTAWAHALVRLNRTLVDREQAVNALSDRLSQDPFLGDAVHSLLTQISVIRSSAEILESVGDLPEERRARFVTIIGAESRRLADVAQALAAFFDRSNAGTRAVTPIEEVDDFLLDRGNYFPVLEQAAGALRAQAGIGSRGIEDALEDYLRRAHDVDPATLAIPDNLPAESRRFHLARAAAERFDGGRPIAEALHGASLATDVARRRAQRVLASYLAGAVVLPYEDFHAAAVSSRYDIDHLASRFGASFEQVCHRLTTLRQPGAEGIAFALLRVDTAGYVTKRLPLPRLLLPRHANACPLWAVYGAFQSPGAMVRQVAAFPGGERFLFLARTVEKPRPAFPMPRRMLSIMLACDVLHADRTVYGDGLDLASTSPAVPVGSNCRLCVRRECAYRQEDPVIDA